MESSEEVEVQVRFLSGSLSSNQEYFVRNSDGTWNRASPQQTEHINTLLKDGGPQRLSESTMANDFAATRWSIEPTTPLQSASPYDLKIAAEVTSIFATEPTQQEIPIDRFETLPPFEFAGLECVTADGEFNQQLRRDGETNQSILDKCDPDGGVTVIFTGPLDDRDLEFGFQLTPEPPSSVKRVYSNFYASKRRSLVHMSRRISVERFARDDNLFKVNFRFRFAGNTNYQLTFRDGVIYDFFGRRLPETPSVHFRTGDLKPRLIVSPSLLLLSPESRPRVRLEVANLTELLIGVDMDRPSMQDRIEVSQRTPLQIPVDRIVKTRLDLREFLSGQSGEFVAKIDPMARQESGNNPPRKCFYGQVTPYNVHARVGEASSLAWVTDLQTGEAVSGADVSLIRRSDSSDSSVAKATTDSKGVVKLPGTGNFLDGNSNLTRSGPRSTHKGLASCLRPYHSEYAVRVNGPKGYATLPLERDFRQSSYRSASASESHLSIWGHSAQAIYRPGEVLQYKILVRAQTETGLTASVDHRFRLFVLDADDNIVHHRNEIELSAFGSFFGDFRIPKSVSGRLRLVVLIDEGESLTSIWKGNRELPADSARQFWNAFSVEVTDFQPVSIRVESHLDAETYTRGSKLTVRGKADRIAGGPFNRSPISVTMSLSASRFSTQHPETKDYRFADPSGDTRYWETEDFVVTARDTDHNGEFSATTPIDVGDIFYGRLRVSAGVQEDRGTKVWDRNQASYRSTDRFVGVRLEPGARHIGRTATVSTVVTDPDGHPINDLPVSVKFHRLDYYNAGDPARVVLVDSCEIGVESQTRSCAMEPAKAGLHTVSASITTSDGRIQQASHPIYVRGAPSTAENGEREFLRLANGSELRSREFTIGDVAKLEIEHTHPNSLALVTVERLGVLDHWVVELEGVGDVIEVPLRQGYGSKVQVSVTVMDANSSHEYDHFVSEFGATTYPQSESFQVHLDISDPERELTLDIATNKDTYKPGEKVQATVSLSRGSRTDPPPPTELAVAVVDQGRLELSRAGLDHFDPIRGILRDMDIDVQTFDLLSANDYGEEVIVTGSYMRETPRRLDKSLSQWIPVLHTGEDGTANFEFEIGDRLTEWKIIVVAASDSDQFGLGLKSIRTNLEIEIHPVLPNQVTDSDVFDAGFAVLNRTESERTVAVEIVPNGDSDSSRYQETIVLSPFERKIVTTRLQARLRRGHNPPDVGSIELLATASADEFSDSLSQSIPVHPARRTFVSSIYGTSTKPRISESVEIPHEVKAGSGSLNVQINPSLVDVVGGRMVQVRDYPYACWEQSLSTAVVAAQYIQLKHRMNVDWPSPDTYIRDVIRSALDYQTESGGFAYWPGEYRFTDPYLSLYTALAFGWLMDAGYEVPENVLVRLLDYLKEQVVDDPPDYLRGDRAATQSIRLLAASVLMQHGRGDKDALVSLYQENPTPNLFAVAQTLQTLVEADAPHNVVEELKNRLANSVGISGDKAVIHHAVARGRNYLLSSRLKTTCSAVTAYLRARNVGRPLVSDQRIAELVRGAIFQWNHRRMGSVPHEAAFCLNAIIEYADALEAVDSELDVEVELALKSQLQDVNFHRTASSDGDRSSVLFATTLKPEHIGGSGELVLRQQGMSRFYYKATMQYEPTEHFQGRENHGIDIRKTYRVKKNDTWVELDESADLRRGDIVRVDLYLDIRDERDFVIVDDPVPGALEPINKSLAKRGFVTPTPQDSADTRVPVRMYSGWNTMGSSRWSFYRSDLRLDKVRFTSDFLRSGRYRLHWTGRVISSGDFLARPAHAETMYAREVYGNSETQRLQVARN